MTQTRTTLMHRHSEDRTMMYEEKDSRQVVGHYVVRLAVVAAVVATLTMPFGGSGVLAQEVKKVSEKEVKTVSEKDVEKILADWPTEPKKIADTTMKKYGLPNEATSTRLIWHNNGPWKMTILNRKEVPHNWPKKHTDMLEMVINYRVPPEKFSQLAAYDGSVSANRTLGEMSAICNSEGANFLALNLAHDIIIGEKNVEEARDFYAKTVIAFDKGEKPAYMQKLQFEVPKGGTGFLDEVTIEK